MFGEKLPDTPEEAVEYARKRLRELFGWDFKYYESTHGGRHYIAKAYDPELRLMRRIYIVYQRRPFMKFKEFFGVDDVAWTINCDILEKLVDEKYDFIVWVDENGGVHIVSPLYMLRVVRKNGWRRVQRDTGEETCHIPSNMVYSG